MAQGASKLAAVVLALAIASVFISPASVLPLSIKGKPAPFPVVLVLAFVLLVGPSLVSDPSSKKPFTPDVLESEHLLRC